MPTLREKIYIVLILIAAFVYLIISIIQMVHAQRIQESNLDKYEKETLITTMWLHIAISGFIILMTTIILVIWGVEKKKGETESLEALLASIPDTESTEELVKKYSSDSESKSESKSVQDMSFGESLAIIQKAKEIQESIAGSRTPFQSSRSLRSIGPTTPQW